MPSESPADEVDWSTITDPGDRALVQRVLQASFSNEGIKIIFRKGAAVCFGLLSSTALRIRLVLKRVSV